jgi:hypothetical protein
LGARNYFLTKNARHSGKTKRLFSDAVRISSALSKPLAGASGQRVGVRFYTIEEPVYNL